MIVILLFFLTQSSQQQQAYYCTRAKGIAIVPAGTDTHHDCFSSGIYNVTNCCFQCHVQSDPITNESYTKCGSLYNYGVMDQGNATVLAQATIDCGGDDGTFESSCVVGTDNSELFGTSSHSPTINTTTAPTNGGGGDAILTMWWSSLTILSLFVNTLH